jgi:hypothetical protein
MVTHQHSAAHDPEHGAHLDPWWADGALRAIETLAAAGVIFSVESLRVDPFSLPDPPHPSHWGAIFAKARTEGVIKPVGYIASRTPSRNGGVQRLWRGTDRRALAA